jgi:hypothetical protein
MIVSYSRNFIFIKTRKTAGTSIEIALSDFCKGTDIITPISPDDEIIRHERRGPLPQNYSHSSAHETSYRNAIESGEIRRIDAARRIADQHRLFWNHMPASEVKQNVSDEFWRCAFKFTIERHPYEKAVSQAYFQFAHRHYSNDTFNNFLDSVVRQGRYRNLELYCNNEVPIVDEVLKYEELPHCLQTVVTRVGIDISLSLPKTKHQFRTDDRSAKDILTEDQKEVIHSWCKVEFDLLNYQI